MKSGWVKMHRQVFKYANKPYSELEAWLWLIADAEFEGPDTGMVKRKQTELAKTWGWDKRKVSRFLNKLADRKQITNSATKVRHFCDNRATIVRPLSICNYNHYQGGCATQLRPKCDSTATKVRLASVSSSYKEEEQRKRSTTTPPVNKNTKAPKKQEDIRKALDLIDMNKFKKKYTNINLGILFEEFEETMLHGTPKKPEPNPYNYKDFSLALNNWCKKRVKENSADLPVDFPEY